jgi:hypothetical protein
VIGNFFGGECSVGIDTLDRLDINNGDNGTYIIKDWQIVGKEFEPLDKLDIEQVKNMLLAINGSMPTQEKIKEEILMVAADELQATQPITPKQIRAIHAVTKELGIERYEYEHLLEILFKVDACKKLSEQQASILIETLNKIKDNK